MSRNLPSIFLVIFLLQTACVARNQPYRHDPAASFNVASSPTSTVSRSSPSAFHRTILPTNPPDLLRATEPDNDAGVLDAIYITPPPIIPPDTPQPVIPETLSPPPSLSPFADTVLADVLFDLDSAVIRPDGAAILKDNLVWLEAHPDIAVTLEGHCDERGSDEYNLALGQHRANAVLTYLVRAGLDPIRFATISYGKTRPFSLGHTEAHWQLNRRVRFAFAPPR